MKDLFSSRHKAVNAYIFILAVCMFFSNGCATTDKGKTVKKLETHITQCTEKYGYNPKNVSGIGERELAQNERPWRSCVYEGIRTLVIPNTTISQAYLDLIAEDRKLTDAIEKGEITRSQRKKRITYVVNQIKLMEEKERAKQVAELKRSRDAAGHHQRQAEVQQNLLGALGR